MNGKLERTLIINNSQFSYNMVSDLVWFAI